MVKTIRSLSDLWASFGLLRQHLGNTTWRATIRDVLGSAPTIKTPEVYDSIWKLKIHGMLSLNLDRFATKAYIETLGCSNLAEFDGSRAGSYTYVLKSPRSFICNLHGNIDDTSSWVLTKSDLKTLLNEQAYTNFINTCLSSNTVVFFGIGVDDIAVGGFLQALTEHGINFGDHYWITDRRDKETDQFAEAIGIRLIRYDSSGNNHSELHELLKDLLNYIPPEDEDIKQPAFLNPCESSELELPTAKDILMLDVENIRELLNNQAIQILSPATSAAFSKYEDFSRVYDEAIYRSWYTSLNPDSNTFCGYTLNHEAAFGAFGRVFHATDSDGQEIAVKLLHQEIRRDMDLLHSFRRGVRSMSILSEHNVAGMVAYKGVSEIPAFVVMDWINGPNVYSARKSGLINNWGMILKIGTNTSSIIRQGHLLPERVLHRDIRPSNIMLEGFYQDADDYNVVVLDFDLSWYKGSFEKSVIHGSTMVGYLAPEQIQATKGVSTRNTAVDSFGLGMTLFFMCSGRDPIPEEHLHYNWLSTLYDATNNIHKCSWNSLPNRVTRLIYKATQQNQSDRWDMSQIEGELLRLLSAVENPDSVESAELLAEELAASCPFMNDYDWDDNRLLAKKGTASGIEVNIIGEETTREIQIELIWGLPGVHGHGEGVGKWIPERMDKAVDILRKAGWEIAASDKKWAQVQIQASIGTKKAMALFGIITESVQRATDTLRF